MAFALDRSHPLAEAIRCLVGERLDKSRKGLDNGDFSAIHNLRKRFKEIRAALRLFRPLLGKQLSREENGWFRQRAAELSAERDAQALIETVDRLLAFPSQQDPQQTLSRLRQALIQRHDHLVSGQQGLSEHLRQLADELHDARSRIMAWPIREDDGDAVASGFSRIYRRGRKAWQCCRRSGENETWHTWRKRAKDYWYHSQILTPLWPALFQTWEEELKQLCDLLGDDHDLAVLSATLDGEPELLDDPGQRSWIDEVIAGHHQRLRHGALEIGSRLYAESPTCMHQLITRLW